MDSNHFRAKYDQIKNTIIEVAELHSVKVSIFLLRFKFNDTNLIILA